jgi:serine/threonine protein kinase
MSDWAYVTELFERVAPLAPADREALLQREEASNRAAASEVRAMLAAHDRAGNFLETPVWQAMPELLAPDLGPSLTGRRIGPYDVREETGRGGMGVVYAAEDVRLGRMVALKVLSPVFSDDPIARERLAQEARAAATLSHPRIATVHALEDIDGRLFIVSELVRGSTLRHALASGALPRDTLLHTVAQIAEALEAAHARGIVHRDLKPENVLVDGAGQIKVVDFGIARSMTPAPGLNAGLTLTGAVLGTPGYMAPEQLRGAPADARADVFAFGVMTYELATGVHPFGGSDPASLVERLVSDDPPLSRAIDPRDLDAIVRRCLRGDPAGRFASGAELASAVRAIDRTASRSMIATARPLAQSAWWWQFHQVAVAIITVLAVAHVGFNRDWLGSGGSAVFLTMLVLATISTTLRLHMWFVSLVHPPMLRALREQVLPWIALAETAFVVACLGCGAVLAGRHDLIAAHLIVTALLLALSLVVIEPATTRASIY